MDITNIYWTAIGFSFRDWVFGRNTSRISQRETTKMNFVFLWLFPKHLHDGFLYLHIEILCISVFLCQEGSHLFVVGDMIKCFTRKKGV